MFPAHISLFRHDPSDDPAFLSSEEGSPSYISEYLKELFQMIGSKVQSIFLASERVSFPFEELPQDLRYKTLHEFLTPTELVSMSRVSRHYAETVRYPVNFQLKRERLDLESLMKLLNKNFIVRKLQLPEGLSYNLDDATLKTLLDKTPHLRSLSLENCHSITDASLDYLSNFPDLESLSLNNCKNLTGQGLSNLQHLPFLKELDLNNCRELLGKHLENLRHCPRLETLKLSGCRLISDHEVRHIRHCPELKNFDFGGNSGITEEAFSILQFLPKLTDLNLSWYLGQLRPNCLSYLQNCPELENLNLTGFYRLTTSTVSTYISPCPKLQLVKLSAIYSIDSNSIESLMYRHSGCLFVV